MEPSKSKLVLIISSEEMAGDGNDPATMDGTSYKAACMSLIVPRLRELGVKTQVKNWLSVDGANLKTLSEQNGILLIGPTWDYQDHGEDFARLMQNCVDQKVRVANPADIVLWNMNKKYLADLEKIGISIPTSCFVETPATESWESLRKRFLPTATDLVLKPHVGAGGDHFVHLQLSPQNDKKNAAAFRRLDKVGRGIVMQEYLPEIRTKGELGFVFFRGEYQYVQIKIPKKGADKIHGGYQRVVRAEDEIDSILADIRHTCRPDFELTKKEILDSVVIAKSYMQKFIASRAGKSVHRYARLDGVVSGEKLLLMELELIEPFLNLGAAIAGDHDQKFVRAYVDAILS